MKVAISTNGEMVAEHFGRCESYTMVEIEDSEVKSRQVIPNPGHEPGFLPGYLGEQGVGCIIAGGMGSRAQMLFDQHQIQTITGVAGTVDDILGALIRGELKGGENICEH